MSEPTVPVPGQPIENAAESAPPTFPIDPELPEVLVPLHEEFGHWWRISYEPTCPKVPYTARPRFGDGRTIRTDTVRLLDRVLATATPDEGTDLATDTDE